LPPPRRIAKVAHHPALPWPEVAALMAALRDQAGVAARALEFTVLTAARTGETLGATWPEIDLGAALWTVPAARMKAGREHRVPLSRAAVDLLRGLLPLRAAVRRRRLWDRIGSLRSGGFLAHRNQRWSEDEPEILRPGRPGARCPEGSC
jgi:integrase